jgi:hypothetical protein
MANGSLAERRHWSAEQTDRDWYSRAETETSGEQSNIHLGDANPATIIHCACYLLLR